MKNYFSLTDTTSQNKLKIYFKKAKNQKLAPGNNTRNRNKSLGKRNYYTKEKKESELRKLIQDVQYCVNRSSRKQGKVEEITKQNPQFSALSAAERASQAPDTERSGVRNCHITMKAQSTRRKKKILKRARKNNSHTYK